MKLFYRHDHSIAYGKVCVNSNTSNYKHSSYRCIINHFNDSNGILIDESISGSV